MVYVLSANRKLSPNLNPEVVVEANLRIARYPGAMCGPYRKLVNSSRCPNGVSVSYFTAGPANRCQP
jgi:hypothetical protein